jgi:hypothetical protein
VGKGTAVTPEITKIESTEFAYEIEDVGSMTVDVTGRDVSYADADVRKGGQE